jgi:hypothetical protein
VSGALSPVSMQAVYTNPQSARAYDQALADATISSSMFTFSGGTISGSAGMYPGISGYPDEYLRDLAMSARSRPNAFTAQFELNQINNFCAHQYANGSFPDAIAPGGGAVLAAANQFFAIDDSYEMVDLVFSQYLLSGTTTAFTTYRSNLDAGLAFPTITNHLPVVPAVYSGTGHFVGFGFQDTWYEAGPDAMCGGERYRALEEMGIMARAAGVTDSYTSELPNISAALVSTLWDPNTSLFWNATVSCTEHSILATSFICYVGAVSGTTATAAETKLASLSTNVLDVQNGQVRHLLAPEYCDAQNGGSNPNYYQNGAYWPTFDGWYCWAVAQVNPHAAQTVFANLIEAFKAQPPSVRPYETTNATNGYSGNPGYCASAAMPLQGLSITSGTFNR